VWIVRADADECVRAQDATRLSDRHVILAQMDTVRLDQPGKIGPVIQNEEHTSLASPLPHLTSPLEQLPVVHLLLAQLKEARPASGCLLDGPVESSSASLPTTWPLDNSAANKRASMKTRSTSA
jgi:hypothetical protein